jgi:phosphate transport system substrate-binding protein
MMKKLYCILFLLPVFLTGSSVLAADAPLVFSGSTTFQKRILEPGQAAIEKKTGAKLEIRGVGSIQGLRELIKGEAAAAMVSVPLDIAFQETGVPSEGTYQEHVILKDVMVPIVHPRNRVKSLTGEQLAGIFSGKITNWKDVGGADQRIVVIISPKSSGTRKNLQETVMNGSNFADGALTAVTTQEVLDLVAQAPLGIGVLSRGFVKRNPGKKVKVVRTKPIPDQLSIVTKGEPSRDLAAVISFLKSKAAKKYFK